MITNEKREPYLVPLLIAESEALLEDRLLSSSTLYDTFVEIAGHQKSGFYTEDDIISSGNYWED